MERSSTSGAWIIRSSCAVSVLSWARLSRSWQNIPGCGNAWWWRARMPGMKRLVAYVVLQHRAEAQDEDLAGHLKQSLPDYMIPAAFVYLEAFPLTPNGKIDRKVLPPPEYKKNAGENYIAPRNPVEEKMAAIWAEVLHLEKVSADAGFFA